TSMNAYRRPGSQLAAMWADSRRAVSASRNSSTKRILLSSADIGAGQGVELIRVRLTEPGQHLQRGRRLELVDARHGETHVQDEPQQQAAPRTSLRLLLAQESVGEGAGPAANTHPRRVGPVGHHLNEPPRYPQTHGPHSRDLHVPAEGRHLPPQHERGRANEAY